MDFLKRPTTDFKAVRDGRASMPLWLDVDLTTDRSISAGTALVLNIAGNSFYTDADTTNGGNALVHFQDTNLGNASAPFFVSPGFIANVGFTQLLIENTAQAGKRMRIFYGVDIDFQAGVNASIKITGTVSISGATTNRPEQATANFKTTAAMVANTAIEFFAPGANINGAILLNAGFFDGNVSNLPSISMISKNSAPANITDGDVLLANCFFAGNFYCSAQLTEKVFIPAGNGLYLISSLATLGGYPKYARWKML